MLTTCDFNLKGGINCTPEFGIILLKISKEIEDIDVVTMMKHSIGLDRKNTTRKKTYDPYRNNYSTSLIGKDYKAWDILKDNGYAIQLYDGSFSLSSKGINEMEVITGLKILDYENVSRWGRICANCKHYYRVRMGGKYYNCCNNDYVPKRKKNTYTCDMHEYRLGLAYGGFIKST